MRDQPKATRSERVLLGQCMEDPDALASVRDLLDTDDFYRQEHRLIWDAINACIEAGAIDGYVDVILVIEQLGITGKLEAAGGDVELLAISREVAITGTAVKHAEEIRRRSMQRKAICALGELLSTAYGEVDDVSVLLSDTSKQLAKLAEDASLVSFTPWSDHVDAAVRELYAEDAGASKAISTGFDGLDRLTGGMLPGDLWVIGACTSVGKSALAMSIALHNAGAGHAPYFETLEMESERIAKRALYQQAQAAKRELHSKANAFKDAIVHLKSLSMDVIYSPGLTVPQLRTKARRLKAAGRCDVIFVDYLQIMGVPRSAERESRQTKVAQNSAALKRLAGELAVPVVVLAQLNGDAEGGVKPSYHNIRESKAPAHDANVVVLLWKKERYARTVTLLVDKNRDGMRGEIELDWIGEQLRFVETNKGGPLP